MCVSCILVVLTCFVVCGFCNVWVCVCGFCNVCGCFDICMGVLVICILVFTVFLYFIYVCLFLFVTSVRTTATE